MDSEDLNYKIKKPLTMDAEDNQETAGSEEFLLQNNAPIGQYLTMAAAQIHIGRPCFSPFLCN